jgi:hypothetical protein
MPVTATPTTPLIITLDDVRGFMRDVAGQVPGTGVTNIMFDLPEFSDADIQRAIKFTALRYNALTPLTNVSSDNINGWILLVGTTQFLMSSEAMRQQRNQVTVADGDIAPIGVDDKAQLYAAMADKMDREFLSLAKNFKIYQNAQAAYGSLGSGYRAVSRFFQGG